MIVQNEKMEITVLKSCIVLPVVSKKRLPINCHGPRGLVVYNQHQHHRACKAISSSVPLRSNINRRNSKRWTSNTVKNTTFSGWLRRQKQPRTVRMGLGSDTGKETQDSRSTWSFTDNLRCGITLPISAFWSFFSATFKDSNLSNLFVLSATYSKQTNWAWILP